MRLEKAAELLALGRRLAAAPEGLSLDEMAATAGVHRRTAQRMRDALAELFPQMEEIADGKTKRFRIPNGLDGLFQTPEAHELSTLAIAAEAFATQGAVARASALDSLQTKLKASIRARQLARIAPDLEALVQAECIAIQAGPRPAESEELLAQLRFAILSMRQLRFVYAGGSKPDSERVVHPLGILFSRNNYLVASETVDGAPKHWRTDRIQGLEVLPAASERPEGFDLRQHAEASFGIYRDAVEDVVLRFTPGAATEAARWRFHGSQRLEAQADGGLRVRFRASGMLELAWHLFTWGDAVVVEGPERLREIMRDQSCLLARHHA